MPVIDFFGTHRWGLQHPWLTFFLVVAMTTLAFGVYAFFEKFPKSVKKFRILLHMAIIVLAAVLLWECFKSRENYPELSKTLSRTASFVESAKTLVPEYLGKKYTYTQSLTLVGNDMAVAVANILGQRCVLEMKKVGNEKV